MATGADSNSTKLCCCLHAGWTDYGCPNWILAIFYIHFWKETNKLETHDPAIRQGKSQALSIEFFIHTRTKKKCRHTHTGRGEKGVFLLVHLKSCNGTHVMGIIVDTYRAIKTHPDPSFEVYLLTLK